jgi:hypothetical protein
MAASAENLRRKHYSLRSNFMYAMFVVAMPVLFVVAGTAWIYLAVTRPAQGAPIWFGVLWLLWVLVTWVQSLKMPFRIDVMDDGLLGFISPIGRTEVRPQEIIAIRQKAFQMGFVEVKHTKGKIRMLQQFTGFHEFLSGVKRANPNVEIVGC